MKRRNLGYLVALLAVVGCGSMPEPANAATITVTYTLPTLNVDGSVIPATGVESLNTIRVEYGTCSAPGVFGTKVGEFTRTKPAGGSVPTSVTNNVSPGMTCVRAFVSNEAGTESDASNVAAQVVTPAKPRPPTSVAASSP